MAFNILSALNNAVNEQRQAVARLPSTVPQESRYGTTLPPPVVRNTSSTPRLTGGRGPAAPATVGRVTTNARPSPMPTPAKTATTVSDVSGIIRSDADAAKRIAEYRANLSGSRSTGGVSPSFRPSDNYSTLPTNARTLSAVLATRHGIPESTDAVRRLSATRPISTTIATRLLYSSGGGINIAGDENRALPFTISNGFSSLRPAVQVNPSLISAALRGNY